MLPSSQVFTKAQADKVVTRYLVGFTKAPQQVRHRTPIEVNVTLVLRLLMWFL